MKNSWLETQISLIEDLIKVDRVVQEGDNEEIERLSKLYNALVEYAKSHYEGVYSIPYEIVKSKILDKKLD